MRNGAKSRREEAIEGLRQLADLLEAKPDLPAPHNLNLKVYVSREDLPAIAKQMGGATKTVVKQDFILEKTLGAVRYQIKVPRTEVCTRTVIGSRKVKRLDPSHVIETEEEIVRWECPPSLLKTT